MNTDICDFRSAADVRCHRVKGHDGGHKPYPVDWDLPTDLADVLRDQSIVVPQDAAVWELIGRETKEVGPAHD
ncbi:MAG: hypothetical protein H0U18_15245 [Pyrinomonadaceae bacterium]|nr:hypothetical protein [Pyrinomonadaceae bacterium]